jgi:hypothetical protein
MAYRVSFFITQQGDRIGGWSENFWNNASDYNTCLNRALALRLLLTSAKGRQAYCPRFRITNTAVFRSGQTTIIPGAGPATLGVSLSYTPIAGSSDYQGTKILLRMTYQVTGALKSTTQWFGGQIDDAIINGGFYDPGSVSGASALFAALATTANGWCVNTLPTPQTYGPIASIDPVTGTVTLPPGGALPLPNPPRLPRIRISGVRGLVYANGLWNCIIPGTPTSPPSFVLQGWAPTAAQQIPMTRSNNPRFANQIYFLTPIQAANFIRSSNHRVGRPTGQFGGRPKKRVSV